MIRRGIPAAASVLLLWFGVAAAGCVQEDTGVAARALLQAAAEGNEDLAHFALERGADVEMRDPQGDTPLLIAARRGQRSVAVILLEAGADAEAHGGHDGNTPLINATFDPRGFGLVAELLARGAMVDARSAKTGMTALMVAASHGNAPALHLLLAEGAGLETAGAEGYRALHFAALTGGAAATRVLLQAGAEVGATAADGETALSAAAGGDDLRSMELLLDAGAAPGQPGRGGLPPLHRAARNGNPGAVRLLLERGADPNLVDRERGNTALMLAANRGSLDILRLLLAQGARVDIVAKDGWTALEAAVMIGDDEAAALLRTAGARE